jgi:fucose 4-O-acetylase-like acetyltransferase
MSTKIRDNQIDSIKGLLMLFVILGHIIDTCGGGVINIMLREFLFSLDMPLFIFISGYFTKRKDYKSFWQGLLPIVVVLLIFQIISFLLIGVVQGKHYSFLYWITPYWTLWYLLSLVFWKIILQYSPKYLIERPWLYLTIAIVVSICCGLMPHGEFMSIQRTFNFFPFFLLGFYMKQENLVQKPWPKKYKYTSWFFIIIVIALIVGFAPDHFQKAKLLLRGANHYSTKDIPLKTYYLIRSFILALSVFIVVPENKFLSYIGRDSMLYFLYHGLIIKLILQPITRYYHLPESLPWVLLYWALVIGIIFIIGKIKPLRWLTEPLSSKKKQLT